MLSSKPTHRRTSTIPSSSSTSSNPPKLHFFPSSSSSSSAAPITEINSTHSHSSHQCRRQKRTKDEGRWFPTRRPRYNSEGKKLKQGSSYPYPSGGNRLPFLKREDDDVGINGEVEEVEIIWGHGKACERDEGRAKDAPRTGEVNKVKDKGKGKEKVAGGEFVNGFRLENWDSKIHDYNVVGEIPGGGCTLPPRRANHTIRISSLDRGSKRDVNTKSTKASMALTRRERSQELDAPENNHNSPWTQQKRAQDCLCEYQGQSPEGDEADIEYAQLKEHPAAGPHTCFEAGTSACHPSMSVSPGFEEPIFARGPSASRSFGLFQSDMEEAFYKTANFSSNTHYEDRIFDFEIQQSPGQCSFAPMGFSETLDQDQLEPATDMELVFSLAWLVQMSMRYSPWSEFNDASGTSLSATLNFETLIAELKRHTFPLCEGQTAHIGLPEQRFDDLHSEYSRLLRELSLLRELQGPLIQFLEATRMQYLDEQSPLRILVVEEYDRLRTYRQMLLERVREVQYAMGNIDGMDEGLEMDRLSLEEDEEHFRQYHGSEPHFQRHRNGSHQNSHFDGHDSWAETHRNSDVDVDMEEEKRLIKEAKARLEAYNKRWEEVLSRAPRTASDLEPTALARAINIPYPTLSSSHPSVPCPLLIPTQAWEAHALFTYAFNILPIFVPAPANSPHAPPKLSFSTTGPREKQIRELMGLKAQLKMEKLRWHEDRLKAVCGDGVAREERTKEVWGVVVDLKREVDERLEGLEV